MQLSIRMNDQARATDNKPAPLSLSDVSRSRQKSFRLKRCCASNSGV